MNNNVTKGIVAGIVATIAMTALMMISALMGMPKMEPPKMLAATMGLPVVVGWLMHFMIGITFTLIYIFLFNNPLAKISSTWVRGFVFGVIAFIMAQLGMMVMGKAFPSMPAPSGDMLMMAIGSLVGHILFGIVVVKLVDRH